MATDDSTMSDGSEHGAGGPARGLDLLWLTPSDGPLRLTLDRALTIGRDASCDVCIPGPYTSREHARVAKDGPVWTIRDLGSKNGVWVDGQRVESSWLRLGSLVRVGGAVGLVVESVREAESDFREHAPGLLGGSGLSQVLRHAQLAAQGGLNIVLEAESGSGKECFARAIHAWSGCNGAFIAINCAALPSSLAEAELFGFVRGAFTGADRNHAGYFRAAHNGTLFLDEVLELPPALQAKLLRVVEQREVIPLGATQPVQLATRIVAACQTSLASAAQSGKLRPDLFARLDGVTLRIPPLRERREDILPLFRYFLSKAVPDTTLSLAPAAVEALCLHDWPLNVRELQVVAQRFGVLYPGESSIGAVQLRALMGKFSAAASASGKTAENGDSGWQVLRDALIANNGNVVRAAELIGISRQRAYRLLVRHPEFDVSSLRREE